MFRKIIYIFLILLISWSCLEPYDLDISNYEDLLVVDALITDEDKNHRVYLSRSIPNLDQEPEMESEALVTIVDDLNNEEVLTEVEPGVYETDKLQFVASIGRTYTLKIKTSKGELYESASCTMLPKTNLDNVHYTVGKQWSKDQTEEYFGLKILVDGSTSTDAYVRWIYEEDWAFRVPFPTQVIYNYSNDEWEFIKPVNKKCWKASLSNDILIHSFVSQNQYKTNNKELCFIPDERSDKISIRYSFLVKQIAISKDEFEFWSRIKKSIDESADFFGSQPHSIVGNIKNINKGDESVLGYFQVGSVSHKRIYINPKDITELGLSARIYDPLCTVDTVVIGKRYSTTLEIYEDLVLNKPYYLYNLVYPQFSTNPIGLVLSKSYCADCTLTGTSQKPDFWED